MTQPPQILLFGQHGQVAHELQRTLHTLGDLHVVGRNTNPVHADLTDPDTIRTAIETVSPDIIVNAAAYTAVDAAEEDETTAMAVNGTAPGIMAEMAATTGALMVHYSTDYVFDGTADRPYTETDPTSPLGAYGRTKLAGEEAVRDSGADHLIFRTAWVYGTRGKNFLLTMQRLAREREELRVVNDQYGSPTWSRTIAETTAQALAALHACPEKRQSALGTYHLTSQGQASWHEFASEIIAALPDAERMAKTVTPITTEEFPTPAKRPAFSCLATDKLTTGFGLVMPHWKTALRICLGLPPSGVL